MRTYNPLDRARKNFKEAVARARLLNRERATVGWRTSATEVLFTVPGRGGYLYVTKPDATVFLARNEAGVPQQAFLPVWVELQHNSYVIVARDLSNPATLINIPDNEYGVNPHASSHQHGGADEVGTATPGANAIVKAESDGKINIGWIDQSEILTDNITPSATNNFISDVELIKLAGIETGADVTDAANVGAAIDGVSELTAPDDGFHLGGTLAGALRWLSWENIRKAAITWTRQQVIAGSQDEIQQRVRAHASQTANVQTWESSGGVVGTWIDALLRLRSSAGAYFRNSYVALLGQDTADLSMTGMYDRNELTNAALRGVVTVTITGAGSYTNTVAEKNKLFDATAGNFFTISGTDATTTQVVIHVDMLALQPNYQSTFWQPFIQFRLNNAGLFFGSYFAAVTVEVSADNVSWHSPAVWNTTDVTENQMVAGYWFGGSGNIWPLGVGITQWRYARFTFSDRRENAAYASKAFIWISEIGLRHLGAPWSRQNALTTGDNLYGDYALVANGAAASAYNSKLFQDGSAIFNEQGAAVDHRIEGDNDPYAFFVQGSTDRVSSGVAAPQGRWHIHDGVGGSIFVTKTGINASAQTIIPNGTGDIVRAMTGFIVLYDGTSTVANAITMQSGDNLDIAIGTMTVRLALNVNGALTVVRLSGTGTATMALQLVWL